MLTSFLPLLVRLADGLGLNGLAMAVLRRAGRSRVTAAWALQTLLRRAEEGPRPQAVALAHEVLCANFPDDTHLLRRLADLALGTGDAPRAASLYARLARFAGGPPIRVMRSARMNEALASRGEAYVAELRDVVLETDQCAVFDGDKVYWREISGRNLANHRFVRGRVDPAYEYFGVACPEPSARLDEPVVVVGTADGNNYAHWLLRSVLKFWLLDTARVPTEMPILVNKDLTPYQKEYFDLLGISPNRLMRVGLDMVLRCRELRVPVLLRAHPEMRAAIDWLRGRLAGFIDPPDSARQRIYISRRDSRHRVLLNEAELEEALAKRGFRSVALTGMSVADQVRTFSSARVVVGPHGAGLANLIFAPPGAAVVEITNTKIRHMMDFQVVAQHMTQRYAEVVSGAYPEHQPESAKLEPQRHDYLVDVDDVLEALSDLESTS